MASATIYAVTWLLLGGHSVRSFYNDPYPPLWHAYSASVREVAAGVRS